MNQPGCCAPSAELGGIANRGEESTLLVGDEFLDHLVRDRILLGKLPRWHIPGVHEYQLCIELARHPSCDPQGVLRSRGEVDRAQELLERHAGR
jgi:hypothetical protein